MSEPIPRVPPGSTPVGGKKERGSVPDEDQFKKIMKVEEVHEIDPHQKRSRKRREEAEGEAEEEVKKAGATHRQKKAKPIEGAEGTPLERKKSTRKTVQPTPPATPPSKEKVAPMAAFNPEEIETYALKEEEETEKLPKAPAHPAATRAATPKEYTQEILEEKSSPPQSTPPKTSLFSAEGDTIKEEVPPKKEPMATPTFAEEFPHTYAMNPTPGIASEAAPEEDKPVEPQKKRSTARYEPEEPTRPAAPPRKKPKAADKEIPPPPGTPERKGKKEKAPSFAEMMDEEATTEKKPSEIAKEKVEGKISTALPTPPQTPEEKAAASKELSSGALQAGAALSEEERIAFLKKTGGITISPEKAEKKEKEQEEAAGLMPGMVGQPSEKETGEQGEGEGKKGQRETAEEIAAIAGAPAEATPLAPHVEAPAPTAPSPYAQMSPQILALFERMVGVMTIIQTTGITETVLTLNARQFASSVLYGSQIIIREYSTAPTKFNVEFIGSPQALSLVQSNIPALLGAVQQGNFNFSINRFDVKLSGTERPIFTRKEPTGEKRGEEEQQEDKDQGTP